MYVISGICWSDHYVRSVITLTCQLEVLECSLRTRCMLFQVFAGLITLRKICNHPDLSTGGPRVFTHDKMYVISGICWSDHST